MNGLKYSWQSEQTEQKKCDRVLILVLAIIIVTGLVILYSTSAYNGEIKFQDTFYYLKKQVFATLLGIMGMWCIANIDYHIWKKWAVPGYLLSILLGVLVMLFGEEYNGSKSNSRNREESWHGRTPAESPEVPVHWYSGRAAR